MSKIFYAIAWYFDISYNEAIDIYDEIIRGDELAGENLLDCIWHEYVAYCRNLDL